MEEFGAIIDQVLIACIVGAGGALLSMWKKQSAIVQKQEAQDARIEEVNDAVRHERDMRNQHVETKIDNLTERIIVMETILKRLDERNGK